MGRLLILLTVGSAVVFVMVVRSPLKSFTDSVFSENQTESSAPAKDSIQKPAQPPAKKQGRKATRSHLASKPSIAVREAVTQPDVQGQSPEIPLIAGEEKAFWATVSSDSAAIYSINFPRGTMLKGLKRGELVQTGLEIVDPEGRWTLVKSPDYTVGYVRSDYLKRTLPAAATRP